MDVGTKFSHRDPHSPGVNKIGRGDVHTEVVKAMLTSSLPAWDRNGARETGKNDSLNTIGDTARVLNASGIIIDAAEEMLSRNPRVQVSYSTSSGHPGKRVDANREKQNAFAGAATISGLEQHASNRSAKPRTSFLWKMVAIKGSPSSADHPGKIVESHHPGSNWCSSGGESN